MRKKKIKKIILTVLILLVVIILINKFSVKKQEEIKRLYSLYEDLNASQTYLFEMEQSDNNKTIMGKKEDKTIIDQYSKGNRLTTIVKDNNTYLVLHDKEEYYIYEQNNVEQTILTDGMKEIVQNSFTTGTEKVKGKKYSYEEYTGSTIFMISSTLDSNENEIKTRFYFDKDNNLAYIRTINGPKQELLKINIKKEVDDSIFEIPSNYAEN